MKSFKVATVVSSILFGVCVFISGCGATTANKPKMEMSGGMMSSDSKMSEDKMSDGMTPTMDKMSTTNKMPTTDKMSGPKMNGMAEGKMEKSDATDK